MGKNMYTRNYFENEILFWKKNTLTNEFFRLKVSV